MTDGSKGPIYVVDDITIKPGSGKAFFDAYMTEYVPQATAGGLTLLFKMAEPAMWLPERASRLFFVWTAPGALETWQAKFKARQNPDMLRWWQDVAELIEHRTRMTAADPAQFEGLLHV